MVVNHAVIAKSIRKPPNSLVIVLLPSSSMSEPIEKDKTLKTIKQTRQNVLMIFQPYFFS